jgi:hypothetical protein
MHIWKSVCFPLSKVTSTLMSVIPCLLLVLGAVNTAYAQGELGNGVITGTGNGPYTYSIIFSNSANATSPIGSVWYAWVPGQFYLPSSPSSASAPVGWTANISGNSVQFIASSTNNDIMAGQSLSGFGYMASFSPATLVGTANSGVSVAYSGGLFSDAGNTFTVQYVAAPEPSAIVLISAGMAGAWWYRRRVRS